MAEDSENDDQWLYGDGDVQENNALLEPSTQTQDGKIGEPGPLTESEAPLVNQEVQENTTSAGLEDETENNNKNELEAEDGELRQNGEESDKEDLEEDDSDDDVNVVIGDIKSTATSYTQQLNIKRGGLTTTIVDKNKSVQQSGKFNVEEFEQIGTITGVSAVDYNLDSLEDKPWRKPGADITDYFNYGFNEDTWKAYCERQKRIRVNESGVGLIPLNSIGLPRGTMPVINDNSKYSTNFIGSSSQRPTAPPGKIGDLPKVNTIQVMTADRREYSRKPGNGFPDMSMPPPTEFTDFQPEYGFNPEPEPFYGGYEPTQDSQWGESGTVNWPSSELKTLTGESPMGPPSMLPPPGGMMHSPGRHSPSKERDRERDSRSRSEKPRERERSHRRERSRSRSRRHRSRSRSPGHRSHKKKKSRRHEDSD